MKWKLTVIIIVLFWSAAGQNNNQQYPVPEFINTIYHFDKAKGTLTKLDKETSKIQTKMKLGGFGGAENGYQIDGSRSSVRLESGENLSFVYYTGGGDDEEQMNPQGDSIMRSQGMDPSMMNQGLDMMSDPSSTTTLYSAVVEGGNRKIIMQVAQGMKLLGKGKKESTKYTFSVKKVRKGYYELVVDKALPPGEYGFSMMNLMGGNIDGSAIIFTFGID